MMEQRYSSLSKKQKTYHVFYFNILVKRLCQRNYFPTMDKLNFNSDFCVPRIHQELSWN